MSSRKKCKVIIDFFLDFLYNKGRKKKLTFLINSGIISKVFCILFSVHIIAHLPFIGRRSNEGACVEQAPFALFILLFPVFSIFLH